MVNLTVPIPSTWISGPVGAPELRSDVSGAVAFLSRPPMFIGQQTTTSGPAPNLTDESIALDTELYDNYGGHQIAAGGFSYYGMVPGWYLAEAVVPLNYSGGAGMVSAAVGAAQNGGSFAPFYGMAVPNNSGQPTTVAAARLVEMSVTGTFGSGDHVSAVVNQSSGSAQAILNGTARIPALNVRWICALAGTSGLPVPANPAWPVPPSFITSAFLNANIRDAIRFLAYPPIMEYAYNTTGQTLASQTAVPVVGNKITLVSDTVDNYSAMNASTSVWTAPVAGLYYAYGQVSLAASSTTAALGAGLTVTSSNYNGGTQVTLWGGTQAGLGASNSIPNSAIVRRRIRLNAGDVVQLAGFQRDSGSGTASVLGSGNWTSKLILAWSAA